MMNRGLDHDSPPLLPGGGEMEERTRALDWSKTPVGPAEGWPQSLRISLLTMLHSRFPMFVWWGRELIHFYNDACIPILGNRHPSALGRPAAQVWPDVWPIVGPQTEAVLKEGRPTWNDELLLVTERKGFAEEAYFTFSYSPLPDDDGRVGGLFCAVIEDTARVLSQRRMRTLRVLAQRTTEAKTALGACEVACATLADNPRDIPFVALYLLDGEEKRAVLAGSTVLARDNPACPPCVELDQAGAPWPMRQVVESGQSVVVHHLQDRSGPMPGGAWPESPRRAIVLPMARAGQNRLAGFVVAAINPRLEFNDDYQGFMDLLAGRIATAIANARAYEEEKKRAESERALRRSDERFRLLFETMSEGFAILEVIFDERGERCDLRYLELNPAFERHTGLKRLDILGRTTLELFPDAEPQWLHRFGKVVKTGVADHFQVKFDPLQRWFEISIYRTGPTQVAAVFFEVTVQKRDEEKNLQLLEELETQHAFLKAVLEQVPAAIVVADAETGRIRMSNDEAHRIVRHEYHSGTRLEDYGNAYIREAYGADGSRYVSGRWPLDRAIRGETVVAEEIELHLSNSTRVIVRVNAGPIRVGDKVVAAVVAFHDVTSRRIAERSARFLADASAALAGLVDYEETLQRLAHLAAPGFADWAVVDMAEETGSPRRLVVAHADPSKAELAQAVRRRYARANPDAPTGAPNIFRTGRAELHSTITDAMLAAAAADEDDLRLLQELNLHSYIGVPLVVQGQTVGVLSFVSSQPSRRYGAHDLAVATDLAARASIAIENSQLYARLRHADRRKTEFLATLAHELRNPLAPLRNGLQIMKMAGTDYRAVEHCRAMMERQLGQMVRLVDDLLDLSRINQGKLELRKQKLELAAVIHSAVETSRPLIDAMGHRLEIVLPKEPVVVEADLTRLAQVVLNLLNNAAKYSDREGRIWLTVERDGGEAIVSVKDAGIGIAADQLPLLFTMFSQVGNSLERSQGGLGIGLTLVKHLVDLHGGRIDARSEGLGKGSEFILRLPVSVDASEPQDETDGDGGNIASRLRILIVDDNRDGADSLAMMLRAIGNDTRTAYDGEQALSEWRSFRPDVMLLDIGMPKLNGYDACRRIRGEPGGAELVIVAQTGWGQEDDRRKTREAGFDHHLVKPVDPAALMKLLEDLSEAGSPRRDRRHPEEDGLARSPA